MVEFKLIFKGFEPWLPWQQEDWPHQIVVYNFWSTHEGYHIGKVWLRKGKKFLRRRFLKNCRRTDDVRTDGRTDGRRTSGDAKSSPLTTKWAGELKMKSRVVLHSAAQRGSCFNYTYRTSRMRFKRRKFQSETSVAK